MVESALAAAQLSNFASEIYVADTIKKYKPAVEIYRGLIAKVGLESSPEQCWLVSGYALSHDAYAFCTCPKFCSPSSLLCRNPFDITGALNAGMRAVWVDRKGAGWVDHCLPPRRGGTLDITGGPTLIIKDLGEIADRVVSTLNPPQLLE